ncbi:MAG: sigma-70 family RNA polymerase sigma factor [Acidobacteria bacterium]|nr:sigma-70 family RNA polymerase sigma factor [Acidobacteriota bacterium]
MGIGEHTNLLRQWHSGDLSVLNQLMELVYNDLHQRAEQLMRRERPDHTLQPAGLLNETYMRLAKAHDLGGSRTQFLANSAHVMRQVLIDHARKRASEKRGGAAQWVSIHSGIKGDSDPRLNVIDLEHSLKNLELKDPRKAQVVVLRFFGGLSLEEVAEQMDLSLATVKREWVFARTWLYSQLATRPNSSHGS